MHALIVTAHPVPQSLTHSIVKQVADGVTDAGHTYEVADLHTENFDPRFTAADLAVLYKTGATPDDVIAEQRRVDGADALVLVYPIYWWSMPALLKGWIDRVFANGWAYDDNADGKVAKKLPHLQVHLLGLGAASGDTYTRHNYTQVMKTQIDHGIFDYCGAPVLTSEIFNLADIPDMQIHLDKARMIGGRIFSTAC